MNATPYIPVNSIMVDSLNNELTTIEHDLDDEVLWGELPENLLCNYLNVYYTIPNGIAEPAVTDINGVYIHNQANVIVGQRVGIKGLDRLAINVIIDEIVEQVISESMWIVSIQSSKKYHGNLPERIEIDSTHSFKVKSRHLMMAIYEAYYWLINSGLMDLSLGSELDSVDSTIEKLASAGEQITIDSNGTSYTLTAIEEVDTKTEIS